MSSDEYLKYRFEPAVRFYQKRLPLYARTRQGSEVALVLGSLSATVLAFANLETWAALGAGFSAIVTAVTSFNAPEAKARRYSDAIHQAHVLLLWWRALTPVEQASPLQRTSLVMRCEELLQSERSSWMSSSVAKKLMQEAADKDRAAADKED